MKRVLLALALLCPSLAYAQLPACTDYVSASAKFGVGDGTIGKPWHYRTGVASDVDRSDRVICMRGGVYTVDAKVGFRTFYVHGTPEHPVWVRNYPGEIVYLTLDPALMGPPAGIIANIRGLHVRYVGLIFVYTRSQNTVRYTTTPGSAGVLTYGNGLDPRPDLPAQTDVKFIDCIWHDGLNGPGPQSTKDNITDLEYYGNLSYYNGWASTDRGHGHGLYPQGPRDPIKPSYRFKENFIFYNASHGFHGYGSGSVGEANYLIEGNAIWGNGDLPPSPPSQFGGARQVLLGGNAAPVNDVFRSNYTYSESTADNHRVQFGWNGTTALPRNCTITDNTIAGETYLYPGTVLGTNMTITGNTFWGPTTNFTAADYPANTYVGSRPSSGTTVVVRKEAYDTSRGHIVIYNWAGTANPTVDVDISPIVCNGCAYKVYDAMNICPGGYTWSYDCYSVPVNSGTYGGGTIPIKMTGRAVARPVTWNPPASDPKFGAFIVISSAAGSTPPNTPTKKP